MRRIIAAALAAALLLTGCSETRGPEKSVRKLMDALQTGNLTRAAGYTVDGSLDVQTGRKARRFYKAMYATMSYVIAETTVDGDEAEVVLAVTMVDMEYVLQDASLRMLDRTLGGKWYLSAEYYDNLTALIKEGSTATSTVTAYLKKTDDGWRVDMEKNAKFTNAIAGGFGEIIGF